MDEKIKRLTSWANGIPAGPLTLELNPTSRCNLHCISCWQREFPPNHKNELSKEKLIQVVKEAAALGVKEFRIPGSGEPLLKEGLLEVMEEAKKQGMNGQIITNGTMITDEIAKRIVGMGWDVATISIDSPDETTNDYLRGKNSYSGAKRAITLIQHHKKITNNEKPHVRINMVLSNKNYHQLKEMLEFAEAHAVKDVQVQPLTVWGKEGKALELTPHERKELILCAKEAVEYARKNKIWTNIQNFAATDLVEKAAGKMDEKISHQKSEINTSNPFLKLPCFEPFYNMIILPDGTVAGCSISGGVDGESLNGKNLKEAWHGPKFTGIRESLLSGNLKDYCRKCCSAVYLENNSIRTELQKTIEEK